MSILGIVLIVVFVLAALLLVGAVLIQNEGGDSLGGLFGGASNSAFGSQSGNVLVKATYVLGGLFFVTCFFVALVNKTPSDKGLEAAAREAAVETESAGDWWTQDNATGTGIDSAVETPSAE